MSVRKIVLLILSILVLGFGLYGIISVFVQLPSLREEILTMFSDPQISSVFPDHENIVNVIIGITVAIACVSSAIVFVPGILGLLVSLGKYKGGVHIVFAWIYVIFAGLGLIVSIVGYIKASHFDWTALINVFALAVVIAFLVIAKQIKEEEY